MYLKKCIHTSMKLLLMQELKKKKLGMNCLKITKKHILS